MAIAMSSLYYVVMTDNLAGCQSWQLDWRFMLSIAA